MARSSSEAFQTYKRRRAIEKYRDDGQFRAAADRLADVLRNTQFDQEDAEDLAMAAMEKLGVSRKYPTNEVAYQASLSPGRFPVSGSPEAREAEARAAERHGSRCSCVTTKPAR